MRQKWKSWRLMTARLLIGMHLCRDLICVSWNSVGRKKLTGPSHMYHHHSSWKSQTSKQLITTDITGVLLLNANYYGYRAIFVLRSPTTKTTRCVWALVFVKQSSWNHQSSEQQITDKIESHMFCSWMRTITEQILALVKQRKTTAWNGIQCKEPA
jgi:hypothetical protein